MNTEWARYQRFPPTARDIEYLLQITEEQARNILAICEPLSPIDKLIAFNDLARGLQFATSSTQAKFMLFHAKGMSAALPLYEHEERILVKDSDDWEVIARSHFPNALFSQAIDWLLEEYGNIVGNPIIQVQSTGTIIFKHPNAPAHAPGLRMIPMLGSTT